VEPDYYTRYPPLGLLKLASFHRAKGDTVELVRGGLEPAKSPDLIHVTSLFTYAWKPVHEAVSYYKSIYPNVKIHLGGIYASLLPEHAKLSGADFIHIGLHYEAEQLTPAWDLIPQWKASILFASRGCIRRCGFCSVPKLEGRPHDLKLGIRNLIYPGHDRVILWDNNILGNANWRSIFDELIEIGLQVDFNQGLDARCMTEESAEKISEMKMSVIRLAYDFKGIGPYVKRAVDLLDEKGVRKRNIVIYVLFNYTDDPEDFFERIRDLLSWGVVSYPMRYEPLTSLEKNKYVSPNWDAKRLEMVADARRVIGYAGAFPPYKALVQKFLKAESFDEAFQLRPVANALPLQDPGRGLKEQAADHQQLIAVSVKKPKYGGSNDWRHHGY
jgi:hypothetical protein